MVLDDAADSPLVLDLVLLVEVVGVGLGGRVRVGVIEQVLDAQGDLLDGNGGLPGLVFVEDGQADGAGRVDVRMEQRRDEFALWRLRRVFCLRKRRMLATKRQRCKTVQDHPAALTIGECHCEFEHSALPDCLLLSGDAALPHLEVKDTLCVAYWLCVEAKRVVLAP